MVGLDGAQLAHQGVEVGVADLGVVEPVVPVVVVGDQGSQFLDAGYRIRALGARSRVPFPAAQPATPEPMTTSGSLGS